MHAVDKKRLQEVTNHPVHIKNNEGDFSASAFIPFCSFGEEFIGTKIDEFEIPVCNIFKAKNHLDQLCYETDLQELKEKDSKKLQRQLEMGLNLVIDYNEERQLTQNTILTNESHILKVSHNDGNSFSMTFDAISRNMIIFLSKIL